MAPNNLLIHFFFLFILCTFSNVGEVTMLDGSRTKVVQEQQDGEDAVNAKGSVTGFKNILTWNMVVTHVLPTTLSKWLP